MSSCLERLTPYLRRNDIAITGGVGIDVGLDLLGRPGTRDRITDLDLVATSIDVVSEQVVAHFLVSHYHVAGPGVPKFIVQIVDPVTRIRIDVFPDLAGSIADARVARVGTQDLPVLPLQRILDHKMRTMSRASHMSPIDPKHVRDAEILGAVLQMPVPIVRPDALAPDVFGIDDAGCTRCELSRSAKWPLAPKERIFELLGWTWNRHTGFDATGDARPMTAAVPARARVTTE